MKRRTLLILSILALVAYQGLRHREPARIIDIYGYAEPLQLDLHVPDEVVSYHTVYHEPVARTGLSLVPPAGFAQRVSFLGYYNGKDTSIDITTDHRAGLAEKKQQIDAGLDMIGKDQRLHEQLAYRKDFKFNGYDAVLVCVSDTTTARATIYMVFGDERFNVAMTGKMAEYNEATGEEMVRTMLSACYAKA